MLVASRYGIDAKLFQWTVLRCRLHLHECVSQTFCDFVAIVLKEQAAAKKDEERMLWSSLSQVQIYPLPTVPTMGHETRVLTQDLYGPSLLTLFSSLSFLLDDKLLESIQRVGPAGIFS